MDIEEWCPPTHRDPANWVFDMNGERGHVSAMYCRWATKPSDVRPWRCTEDNGYLADNPVWTINRVLADPTIGDIHYNGYYFPDALCEKHFLLILDAWEAKRKSVYPEIEALHELMAEVFKHE